MVESEKFVKTMAYKVPKGRLLPYLLIYAKTLIKSVMGIGLTLMDLSRRSGR